MPSLASKDTSGTFLAAEGETEVIEGRAWETKERLVFGFANGVSLAGRRVPALFALGREGIVGLAAPAKLIPRKNLAAFVALGIAVRDVPIGHPVSSHMLPLAPKENEVTQCVVEPVPVPMVDCFSGGQIPSKMLRHEPPVFLHLDTIDEDTSVALGVDIATFPPVVVRSPLGKAETPLATKARGLRDGAERMICNTTLGTDTYRVDEATSSLFHRHMIPQSERYVNGCCSHYTDRGNHPCPL